MSFAHETSSNPYILGAIALLSALYITLGKCKNRFVLKSGYMHIPAMLERFSIEIVFMGVITA